jgi:TolB protein
MHITAPVTRRRSRTAGVVLATAMSAVALSTGSEGAASAAATTTPIVFARYTNSGALEDLYSVPATGGTPTQLTNTPDLSERGPSWSPDGSRIAQLRRDVTGTVDGIWETSATGSYPTAYPGTNGASDPAWSPDGKRIAFPLPVRGGQREIYVINASGSGLTRLTFNAAEDGAPSWSPDSNSLVFSRTDANNYSSLVEINVTSLAETTLTAPGVSLDHAPDWSRGNDIVFSRAASVTSVAHLFVIHFDGTGLHQITSSRLNDRNASWSPDSRRLVFSRGGSDDQDPEQLFTVYSDGSGPTQLTSGIVHDVDADWGPLY